MNLRSLKTFYSAFHCARSKSVALGACFPLLLLACPAKQQSTVVNAPTPAPTVVAATTTAPPAIDGERAMNHVRAQVKIGPRPAGSPASNQTREYIVKELNSYNLKITQDQFEVKTPVGRKKMVNLTAELPGESGHVVLIGSHYDTKLFKEFRFVGANDGASSTAVLLELARVLAAAPQKPRLTYRFVFFDGEEAFCRDWDQCSADGGPDHTYGSRRYVAELKERGELKTIHALILLDMVGANPLRLGRDELATTWLLDAIWQTARELGHGRHFLERTETVGDDDHKPFLEAGVEAVDLIQLNEYPAWHTEEDSLDKISPQSLQIVGDVVLASLPRIEEKLLRGQ
ncbi:MAG TPA: M28 family peptidase [Pyrinomonadaceae bacterium]|nr:M28 family peptidase [Pyrinomonadaceae bacterium]